jgi:signal transduction histidine kinase
MKWISQIKEFDFFKLSPLFFSIVLLTILFQYSYFGIEAAFYDGFARYDFNHQFEDNIVLIELDEESDEFLGEKYPYTYSSHERLLNRIANDGPKIVGYFINFSEAQTQGNDIQKLVKAFDGYIAAGGEIRLGSELDYWGEILPPAELIRFGHSLSVINKDHDVFSKDDVTRQAVLSVSNEPTIHLWIANEFRALQEKPKLVVDKIFGSHYVREADAFFSYFRYYTAPLNTNGKIKRVSFHRALVGNLPRGFFTDKIVLLGSNYISGTNDYLQTPFSRDEKKSSKLSVHANIIQSLIKEKMIEQVPRWVTLVASVILGLFMIYVISVLSPVRGLMIALGTFLGTIFCAYLIFCLFGEWIQITEILISIFVVYYIGVPFRAINEYQRRYKIQEEAKLIKKVESLKQNFISLMSHDLKTPVAKISGLADMGIRNISNTVEVKKILGSITDSTKELNNFISAILDLGKIESSELRLNITTKDINAIIENVTEGLMFEAGVQTVEIRTQLGPLYPIEMDPDLIKRVISNLVENAIKYSGKGSFIEIKTYDDSKWVYMEIKDNGVGIKEGDLPHIFDKFYRVKNDASHKIKGTGLGLYLVKYFVELHEGSIAVESQTGQGTKFIVKLKNV